MKVAVIALILAGPSPLGGQVKSAWSFSFRTTNSFHSRHCLPTRKIKASSTKQYSSLQQNPQANENVGLSKIEAAGVKRFTVGYNKLCKSCPTRLKPRVDTLTEMIVGLPDAEREELMRNVSRRLKDIRQEMESGESIKVVQSARDVYEYQTAGMTTKEDQKSKKPRHANGLPVDNNKPKALESAEVDTGAKMKTKMDKIRMKYESNRNKAARARRLLAVTNALLQRGEHDNEPTIYTVANPLDNGWYHEIDELKKLSRAELKMERLKLNVQKAKYESKVAKARMKLYDASLKLAESKEKVLV